MIPRRFLFVGFSFLAVSILSVAAWSAAVQSQEVPSTIDARSVYDAAHASPDAMLFPTILGSFQTQYPDSASSNANCQLCHVNSGGGEPWNAYGWSVRQELVGNGLPAAQAFAVIEALDADMDGSTNLEEITAGSLPGWTEGTNNAAYFKDGSTNDGLEAPSLGIPVDISITITDTPVMTTPTTSPLPPITSTVPYDEGTDGDLSGNMAVPNLFTLGPGTNLITATSVQGDREYFTIVIPEGHELEAVLLESYTSTDDQSFIGVQQGNQITIPPTATNPSGLYGFVTFGTAGGHVGTDILDDMGMGEGAEGFSGPLPSGTYAFWSQETGVDPSTYVLNFTVRAVSASNSGVYLPVLLN